MAKHEFISADHCEMCRYIAGIREERPTYEHVPGCGCQFCPTVRALADAREAGKEAGRVAKAYAEAVESALR